MAEMIEKALKEGRNTLSEFESKSLLREYGIPVTREIEAGDRTDFLKAIEEIGYPLVIKASASELSHKTESGLVRIDIRNEQEALSAFEEIKDGMKVPGGAVLVQEMVKGPRELVVGLTRDIQFGPCVMFGLGGIFTEILKDTAFRVAPLEREDALDMMQEIKARKILDAVRGMPAADTEQLADILIKVGKMGLENDSIKEIDINPIILSGPKPIAVDALVVLEKK
jgi:acetyl-CoA synthetase (ADP-forming)